MKLNLEDYDAKRKKLISLMKESITIIEKSKQHLQNGNSIAKHINSVLNDFDLIIKNLEGREELIRDDLKFERLMIEVLKNCNKKKYIPGLGLSRGAGEILLALPEEPWINEILDSIYSIEEYWRTMFDIPYDHQYEKNKDKNLDF